MAISKTAKLEFFRTFGANKRRLGVFRGALRVPDFFVASLCNRNYIPIIKLLAISKTAKLKFFRTFEANKGSWGYSAVLVGFQFFCN